MFLVQLPKRLIIVIPNTKNQVNISNHSEKKVVTTKYLAKLQNPTAVNYLIACKRTKDMANILSTLSFDSLL
jgi:hypothetical protein